MFDFLSMADNYESRKVGLHKAGDLVVSTAAVTDGEHPYETAVKHPDYNGNSLIIVESYDSKEDAQAGHDRWISTMSAEPLPDFLQDCQNSKISAFLKAEDLRFPRKTRRTANQ